MTPRLQNLRDARMPGPGGWRAPESWHRAASTRGRAAFLYLRDSACSAAYGPAGLSPARGVPFSNSPSGAVCARSPMYEFPSKTLPLYFLGNYHLCKKPAVSQSFVFTCMIALRLITPSLFTHLREVFWARILMPIPQMRGRREAR